VIDSEILRNTEKNDLTELSKTIETEDIPQLVAWLTEKDDKLRYHAFLLLEYRSEQYDDVYPFWNVFCEKLQSSNSYQRSIGVMLLADNVKWDRENKIDNIIQDYLKILHDEKPITVRQCIQSLEKIIPYKEHLHRKIADELMSINIMAIKETMRKSVLVDILSVLAAIRKYQASEKIDTYIFQALTGGLLDKKSVKQIELMLGTVI
jgi:hypothetical protein